MDVDEGNTADMSRDGGREVGGDEESCVEGVRGEMFAELKAWEEMALPKERQHYDVV